VTIATAAGSVALQLYVQRPPPTLSTVHPAAGDVGSVVPVVLTGANLTGAALGITGTGVAASGVATPGRRDPDGDAHDRRRRAAQHDRASAPHRHDRERADDHGVLRRRA
jgi:hypothetical protein